MAEALNSGDLEAFLARTAEDVEFTSLVAEAEGLGTAMIATSGSPSPTDRLRAPLAGQAPGPCR